MSKKRPRAIDWVARLTDGSSPKESETAYSHIFKDLYLVAYLQARHILKNHSKMEDLVLATLGAVWRQRKDFSSFSQIKTFVHGQIRKNGGLLQGFSSNWKEPPPPQNINDLQAFLDLINTAPHLKAIYIECMIDDLQKISQLAPEDKWILIRSLGDDRTDHQLAEELNKTTNAIRIWKTRAIRSLMNLFNDAEALGILLIPFFAITCLISSVI